MGSFGSNPGTDGLFASKNGFLASETPPIKAPLKYELYIDFYQNINLPFMKRFIFGSTTISNVTPVYFRQACQDSVGAVQKCTGSNP